MLAVFGNPMGLLCVIEELDNELRVESSGMQSLVRSYHAYLTEPRSADPAITLFCDWLQEVGRNGA